MHARSTSAVLLIISLLSATLGGCARDVSAVYPTRGAPAAAVGTVVVELSNPAPDLTLSVNGALVAQRKHTKRVVVTGVPAGLTTVDVAFGGKAYEAVHHITEIDVMPGVETAVVLPGPERSMSGAVETGLYMLGSWIFLGFVYHALLEPGGLARGGK